MITSLPAVPIDQLPITLQRATLALNRGFLGKAKCGVAILETQFTGDMEKPDKSTIS